MSKCGNMWHRIIFLIKSKYIDSACLSLLRRGSTVRACQDSPLIQALRQFFTQDTTENKVKSSLGRLNRSVANSWHRGAVDRHGVIRNFRALESVSARPVNSLSHPANKKTIDISGDAT